MKDFLFNAYVNRVQANKSLSALSSNHCYSNLFSFFLKYRIAIQDEIQGKKIYLRGQFGRKITL